MSSNRSKAFVQAVAKSLEASFAAGTVVGSHMQDKGTTTNTKISGAAVEFVATQLDVTLELIEHVGKEGKVDKAMLYSLLLEKGLAFADFIPSDSVQCMGALMSLGLGLGRLAATIPTGAGAVWAGAMLLTDVYATYVDCKDPFNKATKEGMNEINRFFLGLENEIYRQYGVPR